MVSPNFIIYYWVSEALMYCIKKEKTFQTPSVGGRPVTPLHMPRDLSLVITAVYFDVRHATLGMALTCTTDPNRPTKGVLTLNDPRAGKRTCRHNPARCL